MLHGATGNGNLTSITVVIPAFNRAHLIATAIESVLKQDRSDHVMDIIVVDDGSTDDLAGALRPFGAQVTCIRHLNNSGAAAARNTGVAAARGEYIACLDSDDEWLPGKLQKQLTLMRQRQWALSCTAYYLCRAGAAEIISPRLKSGMLALSDLVWGCFVSPGSTLMFERRLFEEVGPFDTGLRRLEDWDWLLRCAGKHDLAFISEPLARIHVAMNATAAGVLGSIEILRGKHAAALAARDRRHFEAALELETAAAFYRTGEWQKALPALLRSVARSPLRHPALMAVLHNRLVRS
jgi:glycosyltransferase involved in cell wall biosynthesis